MRRITLATLAASGLILTGVLVPSAALIGVLRAMPADPTLQQQQLLGALLFRAGLVVLGMLAIVLVRLPVWASSGRGVTGREPNHLQTLGVLAAILSAATALRLYQLDSGLWYDEIVMYLSYMTRRAGEVLTSYDLENQHSLFTLLAHLAFRVFGDSVWSMRLPAVAFGVASIWAVYLLGRQVGSAREGLLAAALLAVSYHHIWFSQNARGYTGLLFWTLLASWLLLRALREGQPRLWPWYAVAAALGVYTHLTMVFVVLGHFVVYVLTLRDRDVAGGGRWVGFVFGFCLAGLLTLQLHALILPQMPVTIEATVSTVGSWKNPLWTLQELLSGVRMTFAGGLVAVAALIVFGAGLLSFARTGRELLYLLFVPTVIATVLLVARGHHVWPRFYFFTMGFGVIIVVRGATVLARSAAGLLGASAARATALGTACGLALIAASALSVPRAYGPKQDYAGALGFVDRSREPGDAVVTVGLATYPYRSYYKANWDAADTVAELDAVRARAKRTWVLYTLPTHLREVHPDISASIERDFVVVRQFYGTLGGGTIYVSRAQPPAGDAAHLSFNRQ